MYIRNHRRLRVAPASVHTAGIVLMSLSCLLFLACLRIPRTYVKSLTELLLVGNTFTNEDAVLFSVILALNHRLKTALLTFNYQSFYSLQGCLFMYNKQDPVCSLLARPPISWLVYTHFLVPLKIIIIKVSIKTCETP